MVGIYKLTSEKIQGALYLYYQKHHLTGFHVEVNPPLSRAQWEFLRANLPLMEGEVQTLEQHQLKVTEIKGRSIQDKVIMFCQYHLHYRKTSYVAKTLEKANLKGIPVTKQLLEVFFNSPLQNFTLTNYINRINITKDQAKNGLPSEQGIKFPSFYEKLFESKLNPEQTKAYHEHLKSLGWKKDYNPNMGTIWKKPT